MSVHESARQTVDAHVGDTASHHGARPRGVADERGTLNRASAGDPLPTRPGLDDPTPSGDLGPRELPRLGSRPKIKDVIYQELRERIVFGAFSPGDRLIEADLAARFGVSKTPVREALFTLEAEGLVVLRPHRGAEVSRLSVDEWNDLIFLRDVLEVGALEQIVSGMTNAHFLEAEAALAAMTAACTGNDYRGYRRAQRRLHAIILGAPGHPSLPEAAVQLNDRLDRYGRLLVTGDPKGWAADLEMNRRRLELIRQRDTAAYAQMIRGRHADATPTIARLADQVGGERPTRGRTQQPTATEPPGESARSTSTRLEVDPR
jgi:DNA-binding GntR family transcriptional regulator